MAFEETLNPFPLNIVSKEDSWDKLQLMLNIDPKYKIPAAEFNKVIQALNYLYTSGNSENEVIGPYDTYADLVDAYPVGQSNQLAIVYQDEEETDGNFLGKSLEKIQYFDFHPWKKYSILTSIPGKDTRF